MKSVGLKSGILAQSGRQFGNVPWYRLGGVHPSQVEAVYVPKLAVSQLTSLINISNPGVHDAIAVPAPGYLAAWNLATGWFFDGKGGGLDTTLVPASNWTVIVRYGVAWDSRFCGVINFTIFRSLITEYSGKFGYMYTNTNTAFGAGVLIPNTTVGISEYQGYLNGIPDGAPIAGVPWTSAQIIYSLYLGCVSSNGVPISFGSGHMFATAVYNTPLTAIQMGLVMAAMQAL
jgi:hypothetical protein